MRESCLFCVRKHVGQAWVLSNECRQGYPQHRALVIGHLGEAADEAVKRFPALAKAIREERLRFEKDPSYCIDFAGLTAQVEDHLGRGMGAAVAGASLVPLLLAAAAGWFLLKGR